MKPVVIEGANANPGAPKNWDPERDGTCGTLPIRVTSSNLVGEEYIGMPKANGSRVVKCESAWQPHPHELEALNAGAHIVLTVHGWQVPVSLRVEAAAPESQLPAGGDDQHKA
jgi:hypothetical protein